MQRVEIHIYNLYYNGSKINPNFLKLFLLLEISPPTNQSLFKALNYFIVLNIYCVNHVNLQLWYFEIVDDLQQRIQNTLETFF